MKQSIISPKLKFPGLSNNWQEFLLDDVAKRGSGHTPDKKEPSYYEGDIKWVSLADSKRLDKGIISETENTISDEGIKNSSAVLHPAGSVLLSRDAGVGKSAVMNEEMAVSQHFIVWNGIDNKLDNWFLYYKLQILKPLFERIAVGSTIKTIGLPFFKKLRLNLPDIQEQQKIVSFLSKVDEKISLLSEKKDKLTEYKKGVMQQLFDGKWENQDGQLTFIPPTLRFKADDGSEFPDWEEKKLGDVYKIGSSKRVLQEDWKSSGVPFLRTREIIALAENRPFGTPIYISEILFSKLADKYGLPCQGDLLVTGVGTIGEVYEVKPNDRFYFKDGNVIWLSAGKGCDSSFIKYQFKTRHIRKQLSDNASITTVATFTIDGAKKTLFKMPSQAEQTKIANFISAIDQKIDLANSELEKAKEWKKGLLQQMFV